MSIFSRVRKGRKAAQDHHAKKAKQQQLEEQTPRYHHVPTHAATDALLGAPSGWNRDDDAHKIREHNRRRSEMIFVAQKSRRQANRLSPPRPLAKERPRTNSGLTRVSYPADHSYSSLDATLCRDAGPSSAAAGLSVLPKASSSFESISSDILYFDLSSKMSLSENPDERDKGKGKQPAVFACA